MYYGDINNVTGIEANLDFAEIWGIDSQGTTGEFFESGQDAITTWEHSFGQVWLYHYSTSDSFIIEKDSGSSLNGKALYTTSTLYLRYANGKRKSLENPILLKNFSGSIKMKFVTDYGSSAYYRYWAMFGDESTSSEGTRTLSYPTNFSKKYSSWVHIGIGRYQSSSWVDITANLYQPTLNGKTLPVTWTSNYTV